MNAMQLLVKFVCFHDTNEYEYSKHLFSKVQNKKEVAYPLMMISE